MSVVRSRVRVGPFLSSVGPFVSWLLAVYLMITVAGSRVAQCQAANPTNNEWIRPKKPEDALIWGRKDGIVFGLPSRGGLRGPRGLIRVGIVSPGTGKPSLLNFIAIEPAVPGPGDRFSRMAFSELEPSRMDTGLRGKRLWVDLGGANSGDAFRGNLRRISNHRAYVERLSVRIDVERYTANGAHVYLIASVDSDRPRELRLAVYRYRDSPALQELTVTATMGNYERLRSLWLKDRVVDSRQLYAAYNGDGFAEHESYPLDEVLRTFDGDAIALCTSNESSPWSVASTAGKDWHYRFPKRLTQYWRVPARYIQPDLRVRVNGRRIYWASEDPVPGGAAFENFEFRQRYEPGQVFIFGISDKEPSEFDPPIPNLQHPEIAQPPAVTKGR